MTDRSLDAVLETVRERVTPDPAEREQLQAAADTALERARTAVAERNVDATVRLVGSASRSTWLPGEKDIDVFVAVPPEFDRDGLEATGLEIGHAVLPDGREAYAEHPYVTGSIDGVTVDIVPCFDVKDSSASRSAVDRTPFHADYVEARLDAGLAAAVRVLKQFLRGVGIYGSDLKTRGFSGYLTELLVLEHDSARAVLEAAAEWHPPVRLDPEAHGERTFDASLVVVDPTDPTRNVAAVLTRTNLARFQHHARAVLAEPRVERWFPDTPEPIDAAAVREHVRERGTTPVAIAVDRPDLVDDELYPQLRKSLNGLGDALASHGFPAIRQRVFAADRAVLWFELETAARPTVERHQGPPVHVRDHAERFLEQYADDPGVYGPFIEADRYVVERDRAFPSAVEFLESDAVFEARLGPAVSRQLEAGYELLVGEDVAGLADEFGAALADYFDPGP
jgi:tRNA nucleotidyltransferase (CCA-adding enzyme)